MKKFVALILALVLAIAVFGCAAPAVDQPENTTPVENTNTPADTAAPADTTEPTGDNKAPYRVAMVTDTGGINDQSFNALAWAGLQRAEQELGCEVKYFESKTDADYAPNLETAVDEGYDLILCIGFMMADTLSEVAANYPDKSFAIIDNGSVGPNVTGVTFATEQCSYLVGVAAATMTQTNNVGFVIGMVSPLMNTFGYGYYAGVRDTNPDCQIQCYNANNFGDVAGGKSATLNMYTNGADIVFHAAGFTGLGVIEAAKEQGKLAIGVDQDQSYLAPEAVLTSAVKRVDNGVFELCKAGVEGTLTAGDVNYDITTGAVDIAETDTLMSDECKAAVAAAKEKILSGEIKVPATAEEFDALYGADFYTLDD